MIPETPTITLDYFREAAMKRACTYYHNSNCYMLNFEADYMPRYNVIDAEIPVTAKDKMNHALVELMRRGSLPQHLPGFLVSLDSGADIAVCFYYHSDRRSKQ